MFVRVLNYRLQFEEFRIDISLNQELRLFLNIAECLSFMPVSSVQADADLTRDTGWH